ncbi:MAG: SRPBCC family protein [Minwuia sp.]|uniref:SRPBCC family protein n=1 Tax=Minwuia sp. TaxID=2493630 RepID=UPI003A8C3ADC
MTALPEFDPERDLELELVLDAPRAKVWRCMTEAALLEQWMCPRPWTVKNAVVEPEVGGRHGFTMVSPDGDEMPADGVVLDIDEGRKLVTTDAYTKGWRPTPEPFFTAVVTLADDGDGRTLYRAEARHWNAETRARHAEMGFHEGWKICALQLQDVAKGL